MTLYPFIANPGVNYWNTVKHLFCCLQGTKDAQLVYWHDLSNLCTIFTMYYNTYHADNVDNRHLTGDYLLLIAGTIVSWLLCLQTRRQTRAKAMGFTIIAFPHLSPIPLLPPSSRFLTQILTQTSHSNSCIKLRPFRLPECAALRSFRCTLCRNTQGTEAQWCWIALREEGG